MLAATVAKAERPCMSREPGVFQYRVAGFAASDRSRKSDDLKANTLGISEHKLIPPVIGEAVPLPCDVIKTPSAEPVARGIAGCERSPICEFHLPELQSGVFGFLFG